MYCVRSRSESWKTRSIKTFWEQDNLRVQAESPESVMVTYAWVRSTIGFIFLNTFLGAVNFNNYNVYGWQTISFVYF